MRAATTSLYLDFYSFFRLIPGGQKVFSYLQLLGDEAHRSYRQSWVPHDIFWGAFEDVPLSSDHEVNL